MADRVSALADHYPTGVFGAEGARGVTLTEIRDLSLYQIAGWPDKLATVGAIAAQSLLQNDLMFFKPLRDSVSCA